jgi:glycine oxidase
VFDKGAAGAGASHAAAGMLAACAEAEPGEQALVALGRESHTLVFAHRGG